MEFLHLARGVAVARFVVVVEHEARRIRVQIDGVIEADLVERHQAAEFSRGLVFLDDFYEGVAGRHAHPRMPLNQVGNRDGVVRADAPAHVAALAVGVNFGWPRREINAVHRAVIHAERALRIGALAHVVLVCGCWLTWLMGERVIDAHPLAQAAIDARLFDR